MREVKVATEASYTVKIGRGLLSALGTECLPFLGGERRAALLMDETTGRLFGQRAAESLRAAGIRVTPLTVPAGEASKSWERLGELLRRLSEERFTREDVLLALGGGMISDLGGLAAALYQRGMGFIAVPTTLLAAVDAAVGGKNAVNLPTGKNQVGTVRQPRLVLFDPETLETLSPRLRAEGMAEVIKTAMLGETALWEEVSAPVPDWERLTALSVAFKARLVEEDEEDRGRRRLLNLGHTVGHAMEQASGYTLLHGEAVALGLLTVTRAEVRAGRCEKAVLTTLQAALSRWGLPLAYAGAPEALFPYLPADKKREGRQFVLALPRAPGRCQLCPVGEEELYRIIREGLTPFP